MSKELVISSNAHETKVAILEDDQLVEIYFQRANEYSLAGSIHKGRVTRVLPGMQSAFVDLGLDRDTFLYVSDFFEENGEDFDRVEERPAARGPRVERPERQERPERSERPARFDRDRSERPERGGDRGDRSERPDRAERPERAEQMPPPANLIQPPPVLPAAVAPEPADATQTDSRPGLAEDDNRDRRGRRSRRRRSRGRGFPESKYASDLSAAPESQAESVPAEVEDAREVFLLPGESLAKYKRSSLETEAETSPFDEDPVEPEESEDEEPVAAIDYETPDMEAEESAEESPEAAEPEPIESVVAGEAEPELALDEPPVAETNGDAADADADSENRELSETGDLAEASDNRQEDEEEELGADEDFTSDELEELIAEATDDAAVELVEDEAGEAEDGEESTSAGTEPAGDEQPATASVREQSGRYQHRQSRRMRRKQRGDSRGDSRGDVRGETRGEARSESRAETREPRVEPREPREPQVAAEPESRGPRTGEKAPLPSISDLLREGQEIIVQIAKEPLGQKGARITSHIALPGRFVVFMPTLEHLGVSRKIASDEERLRLKKILQIGRTGITGGYIVRTAGEGRSEEEIIADMAYLYNLWLDIRSKAEKRKAPVLLHHDLDIVQRILRDQLSDMFKAIWIDNEEVYESVLRFMQRFQPSLVARVKMYTRPAPIFDSFGVTQEIEKALRPKVWLKSGGYIVINQTEALVAVDVNTGKFVGKSNRLEDTITRTNTEAVKEIVRQIRLRDLGGIIVIDFIDMDERKNRQKVMQALEEAMRADRAPYKILQFNDFGLVAITRKRVKQSLERSLCSPCPVCEGAGYTKSVATVVGEIMQEATKIRQNVEGKNVVLRVYPEVAKFLKSNTNDQLEEIESILGRPVMVMSDTMLSPEKFDLAW